MNLTDGKEYWKTTLSNYDSEGTMIDFKGKVAIVTGAGVGLGRSHAIALAKKGCKVVVNDLGGSTDGVGASQDAAGMVVESIKNAGGEAVADYSDVTNRDAVTTMVASTVKRWGKIDILINNAGILRDKTFAKGSLDDFSKVIDVHLMGTANCTKAVWGIMKEQGYGRIVVTSSSSGLYGNFGQSNYGAAKMGVVGLMNTLRFEGAKYNIKVNALAPTAATRMTEGLLSDEALSNLSPEVVSAGVLFLVSEEAPNGQILCAGAGCFAITRMVETQGVYLGAQPTAEMVRDNWDQVVAAENQRDLAHGGEQGAKFLAMVNEKTIL